MNKQRKNIIKIFLVIVLTFIMLGFAVLLLERKNSKKKYYDFFHEKQKIDVYFLGTSHVINGIFPMELFRDYGIVSYNFGGHANTLPITYAQFINALDYNIPDLVVIDCFRLSVLTNTFLKRKENFHLSIDAFPYTKTKKETICELYSEEEFDRLKVNDKMVRNRIKEEFIFPFSIYHYRWNELKANDIKDSLFIRKSIEKGAESRIAIGEPDLINKIDENVMFEGENQGIIYLKKIIRICKEKNIKILLTYLPFPASIDEQKEANRVKQFSKENNISYINFLDMDIVDYNVDCYDAHSHLNPSGARKVTEYIGDYIVANYNIKDHRQDKEYIHWWDDYKKYIKFKIENLNKAKDYNIYLMLTADKHFNYKILIDNKKILDNKLTCDLFLNIGVDIEKLKNDNVNVIKIDNENNKVEYMYNRKVETAKFKISFDVIDRETGEVLNKKSYK